MLQQGDHVYIIENNQWITEVEIRNRKGDLYMVQIVGKKAAFRVRESRLYRTEEDAKKILAKIH